MNERWYATVKARTRQAIQLLGALAVIEGMSGYVSDSLDCCQEMLSEIHKGAKSACDRYLKDREKEECREPTDKV